MFIMTKTNVIILSNLYGHPSYTKLIIITNKKINKKKTTIPQLTKENAAGV